jgi:hypothetical protein
MVRSSRRDRRFRTWTLRALLALACAAACSASPWAVAAPLDAPSPLARTEFSIARLKYGGGGDWYGDQGSVRNLLAGLKSRAGVPTGTADAPVVTPTDEALFNYPMLFMAGHGNVKFTPAEVERLHRYLTAGGFLWCDDDYGISDSFRREMKRVLPESEMVELPFDHPVFHQLYEFPRGLPKIHEHDGGPARAFGIYDDGRLVVLFTFDTDLGDGLEDEGVHPDPPEKREQAMKMGVNIALFALKQ